MNGTEDDSAVAVSGTTTAEVDQTVTITLGSNTYTATVVAGASGQPNTWTTNVSSTDIQALRQGTITVTADVSDAAGNAATQATNSFVYDTTAPTAPRVVALTTDDTTPVITGTATVGTGETLIAEAFMWR